MARKLRIQYPGAIYHVMNRGDHREPIYHDEQDPEGFLATLEEGCQKTGWQVHSYCLMVNHFHLVLETPDANLVEGMKLAVRLRAETTVTVGWIAERLSMGSRGYLNHLLYKEGHGSGQQDIGNQPTLGI